MISSSIIVISGIVIVLAVTIFFGFIFNTMYNNLTIEHWLPQTIIVGIIITSLATCAGIIDNNNSKVKKNQLKTQLLQIMIMSLIIIIIKIIKLLFRVIQSIHFIMIKELKL